MVAKGFLNFSLKMDINYWIISPNVHNDATEQRWKEIIAEPTIP